MPVQERDLIIPALRAAAARPKGEITTTDLITVLTEYFEPEGRDAEIAENRSDTYFSQKVRNLISHRASSTSMFSKGYAVYHPETESIKVTVDGHDFLAQVPDA